MIAKFGFQVTVEQRTIWIFPEDIDAAAIAAQAEALLKKTLAAELAKKFDDDTKINTLINGIQDETIKLKVKAALPAGATVAEKLTVVMNKVSLLDIQTSIDTLDATVKTTIDSLKARANTGIIYGWMRGPGEDPISLGVFRDLTRFIDRSIIGSLPSSVRPSFSVDNEFEKLVNGLPDPINSALTALTTKAVFELDSIRLKIPGKGSVLLDGKGQPVMVSGKPKPEPTQFEIAMLINLLALDLELGPFQLNRLYAKLGNFGSTAATPAK